MRFLVGRMPGDPGLEVEADEATITEGGALRLWSGNLFQPVLVRAFSPIGWLSVRPLPVGEGS